MTSVKQCQQNWSPQSSKGTILDIANQMLMCDDIEEYPELHAACKALDRAEGRTLSALLSLEEEA